MAFRRYLRHLHTKILRALALLVCVVFAVNRLTVTDKAPATKHNNLLPTIAAANSTAYVGVVSRITRSPDQKKNLSTTTDLEFVMKKTFNKIYNEKQWGKAPTDSSVFANTGISGLGSLPNTTEDYRAFISQFLKQHGIQNVVDIPCGLWTFSHLIDWKPVKHYTGIDIVDSVVQLNAKEFGSEAFKFRSGSLTEKELPPADLLICKDAFQHLPLHVIQAFIENSVKPRISSGSRLCRYRYLLVTNDVFGAQTANKDMSAFGGYASRDLTLPPFNLDASWVFRFSKATNKRTQLFNMTAQCDVFMGDADVAT